MLVSFISAIGILGTPAEMYAFGTQFSMYVIAAGLGCVYGAFIFVPLFYPLKLTSSFEVRMYHATMQDLSMLL